MNRAAIAVFAIETGKAESLRGGRSGLGTFESGFLTLSIFPFAKPFFPKLFRARERAAAVMLEYMRRGGYKTASGLATPPRVHSRFFSISSPMTECCNLKVAYGEPHTTRLVLCSSSTAAALWIAGRPSIVANRGKLQQGCPPRYLGPAYTPLS
ncbi:hypothetical protein GGS24DRAFT_505040 [Hypoxylon argillaceum]|nr:hypothetical protein GGS24DRAFT_505040 [Hypoxylon argillaceum]KAI1148123.1 hypothetical protein F4825DRAFT_454756 [Nemania diffusa]